ncbi:MAG: tripartite tricarboxylate transporter substrate binding protein [Burkholderiales bacterium]
MIRYVRSSLVKHVLGLMAAITVFQVCAQGYPNRQVKMIIPLAPGGATDALARIVAQKLSEAWGQQVVIENRAGAGGTIGTEFVARSPADGYTMLLNGNNMAVNLSINPNIGYHPVKDFTAVSMVASTIGVMLVAPSLPAKSVKEVIAMARAQPGKLTYGSTGNGTAGHLNMELFKLLTGINVHHVPYKAVTQAQTDLMGDRIDLWIASLPPMVPLIKAGKLRALSVSGKQRSGAIPDVPTMDEAGVTGYEALSWFALFVPAATPRDVVSRTSEEVARAVKNLEVRERLAGLGIDPVGSTPEFMAKYLTDEIAKWAGVVKATGMKLD